MEKKKLKKSAISIVMYVVAALFALYGIYQIWSAIAYLVQYFTQYGMSISSNLGDAIPYVINSCFGSFAYAFIILGIAFVYREIRKLSPENFVVVKDVEKAAEVVVEEVEAEVAEEAAEEVVEAEIAEEEAAEGKEADK